MTDQAIRMGTCSWNYPSWEGLVYSKPQRSAADYLPEYASRYSTVEIDSWFYKIPAKSEAERYAGNVPDDFRFTCKVFRDITMPCLRTTLPNGQLERNASFLSPELFKQFVDGIEPALPKIPLLMFEFEYLNTEKMPSLRQFMDLIGAFRSKIEPSLPIGIEIRNKNYLTPEYFAFLEENGISHVYSQKLYMPHVFDVHRTHPRLSQPVTVIRLLGDDRQSIELETREQWNRIVAPKPEKDQIVKMSIDIKENGGKVIINVNNHYEGCSPKTIDDFRMRFAAAGVRVE